MKWVILSHCILGEAGALMVAGVWGIAQSMAGHVAGSPSKDGLFSMGLPQS